MNELKKFLVGANAELRVPDAPAKMVHLRVPEDLIKEMDMAAALLSVRVGKPVSRSQFAREAFRAYAKEVRTDSEHVQWWKTNKEG